MISAFGLRISAVFRRTAPDPFVLAVLLTLITAAAALTIGDFRGADGLRSPPTDTTEKVRAVVDAWRDDRGGAWSFLAFSMQMCLVLVTGHALAASVPVARSISAVASIPRSTASGAAMVAAVACLAAVVNWGLGLIAGALLAREVGRSLARRGVRAHYPLIAASGYVGLLVWHGGFSGSAPLSMTTGEGAQKVLRPEYLGALGESGGIPLSETVLSSWNLLITGGLVVLAPLVLALMAPRRAEDCTPIDPAMMYDPRRPEPAPEEPGSMPDWLERAWVVAAALAVVCVAAVMRTVEVRGAMRLGLNEINALMLAAGLVLHGSLRSYARAAEEGAKGCSGIILQFPLYAGIMGVMVESGLVRMLAAWIAEVSTPGTLPLLTFFSAAALNLAIPSGGGQWAVQGPVALESAMRLGVAPGRIVMAVAYGDQLTNMLQPFWALPLLAITGVRARDIVGYTAIVMLASAAWVAIWLLVL